MKIDPIDIYNKIKRAYPDTITTICDLHKPCCTKRGCFSVSWKEILDFDKIKEQEDIKKGIGARSSVDAIAYKNSSFCFIELKGWKKYFEFNNPNSEAEVWSQIKGYKLEKKVIDSIQIIREIIDVNIFDDVSVSFILVTDIEVNYNGIESLLGNGLIPLSLLSSNCADVCNFLFKQELEDIKIAEVDDIEKIYINCRDFDSMMNI